MENIYKSLELSTQIIIEEAFRRGIAVEVLDEKENVIRLTKGDKTEYIQQATKTSADNYIVPLIMENKQLTKLVLKENGINVPHGIIADSIEEALQEGESFDGMDIVVKPNSTNFGQGVVILDKNRSKEEYGKAVRQAFTFDSRVLVEHFITGKEYRFLVIKDQLVGILHRVPANVVGDGLHSINELVHTKNQSPLRGKGYVTPLERIELGEAERSFLQNQGLTVESIPLKGEIVYLRENSNISTGGDSLDYTDIIDSTYKEIAVHSAKVIGAKICGVDMIIKDLSEKPNLENYSIIELNFNPAIHIHDYPYQGQNRHVEKYVLNLLGFSDV